MPKITLKSMSLLAGLMLASQAEAAFTITLNGLGTMTPAQQAVVLDAKSTWESIITGYKPGVSLTGVTMDVYATFLDGAGGVLAQAGYDTLAVQAGTKYTKTGTVEFDSSDANALIGLGLFDEVMVHEMGHVLGIGTLWELNNLYVHDSGQYTGAAALAAYRTEFDPSATFVPVELSGGGGTANYHWAEPVGANAGIVSNVTGQSFRFEMMTGYIETDGPMFLSSISRATMVDLGYTAIVPEPSALALLTVGTGLLLRRRG